MVGLWLVCCWLRQREDEKEKWGGVPCGWCAVGWCAMFVLWVVLWVEADGWCCELRPVGCAMGGAVGLWWVFGGCGD